MKFIDVLLLAVTCAAGSANATGNTCGDCCQLLSTYLDIYEFHQESIDAAGAACVLPNGEAADDGDAGVVCEGQVPHLESTFMSTKYFLEVVGNFSKCDISRYIPKHLVPPVLPEAPVIPIPYAVPVSVETAVIESFCKRAKSFQLGDDERGTCSTIFTPGPDGVNKGNSEGLEPANTVSVEVWVKDIQSTSGYFVAKGAESTCSPPSYFINMFGGGMITFGVRTSDMSGFITTPFADKFSLDSDHWHHIAGTYDGIEIKLYVDGSLVGVPIPVTGSLVYDFSDNDDFRIGTYEDSGCTIETLAADIAGVSIWEKALSAAEVATLSASTQVLPAGCPNVGPDCN